LLSGHVHMRISIPPQSPVAQVIGFMKGKSAIHLARVYRGGSRILRQRVSGRVGIWFRRLDATRK